MVGLSPQEGDGGGRSHPWCIPRGTAAYLCRRQWTWGRGGRGTGQPRRLGRRTRWRGLGCVRARSLLRLSPRRRGQRWGRLSLRLRTSTVGLVSKEYALSSPIFSALLVHFGCPALLALLLTSTSPPPTGPASSSSERRSRSSADGFLEDEVGFELDLGLAFFAIDFVVGEGREGCMVAFFGGWRDETGGFRLGFAGDAKALWSVPRGVSLLLKFRIGTSDAVRCRGWRDERR